MPHQCRQMHWHCAIHSVTFLLCILSRFLTILPITGPETGVKCDVKPKKYQHQQHPGCGYGCLLDTTFGYLPSLDHLLDDHRHLLLAPAPVSKSA